MKRAQWFLLLVSLYLCQMCQIQAGVLSEFVSSNALQVLKPRNSIISPLENKLTYQDVDSDKAFFMLALNPNLIAQSNIDFAEENDKVRQYGGGQSRSRRQGKGKKYHQTAQSSSVTRSHSSLSMRGVHSTEMGTGDGDDDEDPPLDRNYSQTNDTNKMSLKQSMLVGFFKLLLKLINRGELESLADYLERHLSVYGEYGQGNTSTINMRLYLAIERLGLIGMEWIEVLKFLQVHPEEVESFVQNLGQHNVNVLLNVIKRQLSLKESEVVETRFRPCNRLVAARPLSISMPDLFLIDDELKLPNPTLVSTLYPLFQKILPRQSKWRKDTTAQEVLGIIGQVYEEFPSQYRYLYWLKLMQTLGLPKELDFNEYRFGMTKRIHEFMINHRGSRRRLAQALSEILPANLVNGMILNLIQFISTSSQTSSEVEVVKPVSHEDEAGLEDLLKKLQVIISDDELRDKLVAFLQAEKVPLDTDNLNDVFYQQLNIPFAVDRWRQAFLLLQCGSDSSQLFEFLLELNRCNRVSLAWAVSMLNHVAPTLLSSGAEEDDYIVMQSAATWQGEDVNKGYHSAAGTQ